MAQRILNSIFMSASVPLRERHEKYYATADIVAIRDAVRALATVVIPKSRLVWGGHPAITPLIRYVLGRMNAPVQDHVTLYQSEFFRNIFPPDNEIFENVLIVPKGADLTDSLKDMRMRMIGENSFSAGIFIGGMEGVEEEFAMFRERHSTALALPVASTGAAAATIYERMDPKPSERLVNDYAYMAMFRSLLREYIS